MKVKREVVIYRCGFCQEELSEPETKLTKCPICGAPRPNNMNRLVTSREIREER